MKAFIGALAVGLVLLLAGLVGAAGGVNGVDVASQNQRKFTTSGAAIVTDSTTLTKATDFTVAIKAGVHYSVKGVFFISTQTTSGFKFDMLGDTTVAGGASGGSDRLMSTVIPETALTATYKPMAILTTVTASGETDYTLIIEGGMNCSSSGNWTPRFAQNSETGAAESVSLKAGSFLEVMPCSN